MSCIGWDSERDPQLHDHYARKLVEPGWAGEINKVELTYIKSKLRQYPSLRRRWGFRSTARRLPAGRIRQVATYGVGNSAVLASLGQHDRCCPMKDTQVMMSAPASDTKTGRPQASRGRKQDLARSHAREEEHQGKEK